MNIAFLHKNNDVFISLRSIAEAICLPEMTVRCRLFERKVDKAEYVKGPDSFYISENAACQLLNDIEELHPEARNLERFHIWMHSSFEELGVDKNDICDSDCDEQGEKNVSEFLCELFQEIIDILKCQKLRMDMIEERLEEKS